MVTLKILRIELAKLNKTMATKAELKHAVADLKETMATKAELEHAVADLKETMATKQDQDKLMTLLDEVVTEVRASREERMLSGHQFLRIDDKVFDHEKRIRVLEKK